MTAGEGETIGTGYVRQDVSDNIDNGKTASAVDIDNEFDAIQTAFSLSGHTHDGTAAEGGAIEVVGPAQEYVGDGTAFYPKTNGTYNLGAAAFQWDDFWVSGTSTLATVDINGGNIDGTIIGGTTPAAGTFTTLDASGAVNFTGNITLGNADTDTVTVTADVASNLIPSADDTYDLGASGSEWKDLYIDGTANIDNLSGGTAVFTGQAEFDDILVNGGAIQNTPIGSVTSSTGVFTTLTASGTASLSGDVNLGNAGTDSITFTGRADSDLLPIADSTHDLGSSSLAWAEVHADDVIVGGESLLPVSGTWTARITDSSGNNSSTTVTGNYYTIGDLVFCNFASLNSISTAGLTGTDDLRVDLPFQCAGGQTATGTVQIQNLASLTGSGDGQIIVRVVPGATTARLVNNGTQASGASTSAANLRVQDVDSGVTDITAFSVVYKKI